MLDSSMKDYTLCTDCGEVWCKGWEEHYIICDLCKGAGGYDATKDCEMYDDWQECPNCEGRGHVAKEDY